MKTKPIYNFFFFGADYDVTFSEIRMIFMNCTLFLLLAFYISLIRFSHISRRFL